MTAGLTRLPGVPDSADVRRHPGMAHFPGTGPLGRTCGDCRHRSFRTGGRCAIYKQLTGKVGAWSAPISKPASISRNDNDDR